MCDSRITLSARALALLDGGAREDDYYERLSDYHLEVEDYERCVEAFHAGDEEVFARRDRLRARLVSGLSLSPPARALACRARLAGLLESLAL